MNDDDSGLEFFWGEGAFLIAYGVHIVGLLEMRWFCNRRSCRKTTIIWVFEEQKLYVAMKEGEERGNHVVMKLGCRRKKDLGRRLHERGGGGGGGGGGSGDRNLLKGTFTPSALLFRRRIRGKRSLQELPIFVLSTKK